MKGHSDRIGTVASRARSTQIWFKYHNYYISAKQFQLDYFVCFMTEYTRKRQSAKQFEFMNNHTEVTEPT